ncbi:hypothetical protein H3C70_01005 [Patescibacteria group bacterium]|nr:hypothetical protein [Patescibacteria group bacterium]
MRLGDGFGEGEGLGDGVGLVAGLGVGEGVGLRLGLGEELGEGLGETDWAATGKSCGRITNALTLRKRRTGSCLSLCDMEFSL